MCNLEGHCHLYFGFQKLVIGLEEGGGGGWLGWFWLNIRNGSVEPFNWMPQNMFNIN